MTENRIAPCRRQAALVSLLAALAILAFVAVAPRLAEAHAAYDHSVPNADEVVATAPDHIDVYFKEEIARANGLPTLVVVNSSGDQVDTGSTLDDDDRTHISAPLKPDLPDGTYTVIWHDVSANDGDEARGSLRLLRGFGPDGHPGRRRHIHRRRNRDRRADGNCRPAVQ